MATPTKFTPETRAAILKFKALGMSDTRACANAGISRRTLADWKKLALEEPEGPHAEFFDELQLETDKVEGKLEAIHTALATGTKDKLADIFDDFVNFKELDGHALRFQLQCGGSRPWAEVKQVEVTGKDGGALEIADKASARIGDALRKMAALGVFKAPAALGAAGGATVANDAARSAG